jgi:hypothetical protein
MATRYVRANVGAGFNPAPGVQFRKPSMFTPGFGMGPDGTFGGFGGAPHPFQQSSVSRMTELPAPGGGGVLDKLGGMFKGEDGTDKLALILGAGGLASDIYSKHKAGKVEEEERERKRRAAESVSPLWAELAATLGR